MLSPEASTTLPNASSLTGSLLATSPSQQPNLSSIAERRSGSGEEESEDEDDEGGWRESDVTAAQRGSLDETVLMAGYLWKKGERRKVRLLCPRARCCFSPSRADAGSARSRAQTWKKRWFVLRPAHIAVYKTSAEYKLLRLVDLAEVHACTPVVLKKHANTLGLVSPTRTFYLQAETPREVQDWVRAISDARQALLTTASQTGGSSPVPIPTPRAAAAPASSHVSSLLSHSPHGHHLTSSDSDDASPAPAGPTVHYAATPTVHSSSPSKDAPKVVLSGYLMKCGSRRHNWHKRWFVLSGEKLVYSRSHMVSSVLSVYPWISRTSAGEFMSVTRFLPAHRLTQDTKPHREIPLAQILDALEYDLPPHRHTPSVSAPAGVSPPQASSSVADGGDGTHGRNTFKVITTKRTLLVCAPSEEEEIKWLSAVRALIARRSGAGVVPGDAPARPGAPGPAPSPEVHGSQSGNAGPGGGVSATVAPGLGMGGQKRRDSFARRLSLSGGGAHSSHAPQHGQEAVSERQS